ncbi:MAG: hypothetical protein E7240_11615, partial [Lachnospiraceae bacterium]|nr:hypothetical protein [Lachnospiraceae bacterium]
ETQQFLLDNRHSYNISYVQRRAEDVEEDVRRGVVRFGLVYQPTQENQFDVITLKEETLCFLVSRKHPLADRQGVSIYQMAQYPMVMPDEHTAAGRLVCRMFQAKGLMPYVILPSLAISEITRLTAANPTFIGCAVESDLACVRTEGLKKLSCAGKLEKLKMTLICRRSIPLARHEKKFRDELCETFRGESDE